MFGPAHLLHERKVCPNVFDHDQSIHYMAHMEELETAVQALLNGEDYEFWFDLDEFDKNYIEERLKSVLGSGFSLDFH